MVDTVESFFKSRKIIPFKRPLSMLMYYLFVLSDRWSDQGHKFWLSNLLIQKNPEFLLAGWIFMIDHAIQANSMHDQHRNILILSDC